MVKFKSKLICLLLVFVMLLSASAVAANENTTQSFKEVPTDSLSVNVETNNEILEILNNEEVLGAKDNGTFTALQEKINNAPEGSIINLENDYRYNEGFRTSGIYISGTLTINGNGHTIDALNKSAIFDIGKSTLGSGYDIYLNDIQFINACGSAISFTHYDRVFNIEKLHVSGCSFVNCDSSNGVISSDYSDSPIMYIDISNCSFLNNSGDAINAHACNGFINNCRFAGNSANYTGSVIYSKNGNITISNCSFLNNYGQTIKIRDFDGTIYNCSFIDNSVCYYSDTTSPGYYGGVIDMEDGNIDIVKCSFTRNSMKNEVISADWGNITISDCSFEDNSGHVIDAYCCDAKIYNCSFENNSAIVSTTINFGGAIVFYGGNIDIVKCRFTRNSAKEGCGVCLHKCNANIYDCHFSDNRADYAGAIYYDIKGNLTLKNSNINHNSIYFTSFLDNNTNSKANFLNLNFSKNNDYDGLIYVNGNNLWISRVAGAEATVNIGGKIFECVFDVNGYALINLESLDVGTYDAKILYWDDELSASSQIVLPITIGSSAVLDVPDVTKYYGGSEKLEITLSEGGSPIANADINININNNDYIKTTDSNGKAFLDLNLNAGKYDATVIYQDVSTVSKVIINQLPTTTTISYNKNSRNNVTLTALVSPSTAGGNVVFTINGKNYTADIINGKATRTLSNLATGNYEAKAIYQENVNHKSSTSSSVKFTVDEANIELKVPDVTKNYGGSEKLEVTLTEDGSPIAGADVIIQFDAIGYGRTTDSNGKVFLDLDLNAGSYDARVSYQKVSTTAKITINQLTTKTTVDYTKNPQYSVTLTALIDPATAGGNVTFTVNGKNYSADKIINGKATRTLTNLAVGNYEAKATYEGDINYKSSSSDNLKFTIKEHFIIVSAPDVTKYYGGDERFVVTATDNTGKPAANEQVKVTINGQVYDRKTGDDGRTTFAINLRSGSYEATTEHDGEVIKSTITVKTTVISNDVTKIFRNRTNYEASFLDSKGNKAPAGEKVSININGVFYQRTIKDDGSISFALNLEQGTYILTMTNPYTGEEISNTVKILPNIVENKDLTKYYRNGSQFTFKLLDDKGNPVAGQKASININGVFYTRTTNDKGIATFQINLEPGTYILTMEYKGCRVSNTVTVLSVIQSSDIKMKYQDGTRFKVTILDGVGKPYANQSVSFNINGVFYYRITGTDGSASLAINLMAGEYIITTTYNSLNVSNKVTISS